MDLVPVYTAFVGAIVGAVAGQLLSHFFTKRRDKQKEARETFQKFIYPSLNDVILYYDTETNFRKAHDVERNIDSKELANDISKNIKYGNSKLIGAIIQYNSSITFFDGRGNSEEVDRLKMYFWFLDFSLDTIKKMGMLDHSIAKKIKLTQKKYGIWGILTDIYGVNAIEILQYDWMWKDSFLENYSLKRLRIFMEMNYFDSDLKDFIFELKYAFEMKPENHGNTPEHINELFDEYLNK